MDENQVIFYDGNQIKISQPDTDFVNFIAYIRPNDKVVFDFELKDFKVDFVKGDMHIIFPNGSSITIVSLLSLAFTETPALMFDKKGNQLSIEEFLNQVEVLAYNQATLILANRDEYKMSTEKPDIIQIATDQDSTLEAGIPITGVGEADAATKGTPSNAFDPRGIVFEKNDYMGDGFYVVKLTFTNSPYNLDKDDRFPGNTEIPDEPTLDYYVYYGSKLVRAPNENMDNNGYVSYQYSNGYDFTVDPSVQAGQNDLDLSNDSSNIYINNHTKSGNMRYKVSIDYSKGVFPNKITLIVPSSVANSVSLDIPGVSYYTEVDAETGDMLYIISSPDPIGTLSYFINFDEGMDSTVFDISYKLEYFNPSTGTNDSTYVVQSFQIKPVGTPEDVNVGSTSVLSSTPNGMNTKTGSGNDVLTLGGGKNNVETGLGDDKVFSGKLDDTIFLGEGNDMFWASVGYDIVDGGTGDDIVFYNNTTQPTIDPSNEDFKMEYYNTYISYTGVIGYIGFDKASLLKEADKYSASYSIKDYLANFLEDGDSLVLNPANFSAYKNIETFVFSYLDDKITVSTFSTFLITLDGDFGVDTLIIDENFSAGGQDGAVVDLYYDSSTLASISDKSGNVLYNLLNFEAFYGSASDDVFYSYYNPNYDQNDQYGVNMYSLYGNATKTTNVIIDYDLISYEKLKGGLVAYVGIYTVEQHYGEALTTQNGNIEIASTTYEVEAIHEFEAIQGTTYADLYYASSDNIKKDRSLDYLQADNSSQTGGEVDVITYEGQGNVSGVTVDLAGFGRDANGNLEDGKASIYKSTAITSLQDPTQLIDVNKDTIATSSSTNSGDNYKVVYTSSIDTFFSVEDKNVLSKDIDGGAGRDVITYADFKGAVKVDFTHSDRAIVYKQLNATGTGDFQDEFTYYTSNTYSNSTQGVQNIGTVVGTAFVDTLVVGYWFLQPGNAPISIDYKANADGLPSGTPTDILELDSTNITDFDKQGYEIRLGRNNQVSAYDDTDPNAKPTAIVYTFSGVYDIVGSKGADSVVFESDITSIDEINAYNIDLGDGNDTVNYANFQLQDPATKENVVLSVTYDSAGVMVVEYVIYDDKTRTWTSLATPASSSFANVESLVGTSGTDYFKSSDGFNLSYDGWLGEDLADYSAIQGNITANFALQENNITKDATLNTTASVDSVKNVYEIIGSNTGNNVFFAGQNSMRYTINNGNPSSQVNSLSYIYYSADVGVVIDYTAGFFNADGTPITDNEGNAISPDGSAIVSKGSSDDEVSKNISTIYGSNLSDTFILYELTGNITKEIYGYDETIAGNVQTTGIDTADFSKAVSGTNGLTIVLTSTSNSTTIDTGSGTWILHGINGLILTNNNDNVTLDGAARFNIDGLDGEDTVIYTSYNGTGFNFNITISLDGSGEIDVEKSTTNPIASYNDRLKNIEILVLSDRDDYIKMVGEVGRFGTSTLTSIDAGGGYNILDLQEVKSLGTAVGVSITSINDLLLTSKPTIGIDIANVDQINASYNAETIFDINYTHTNTAGAPDPQYYKIFGSTDSSTPTTIDFNNSNTAYQGGLVIDMSLFDSAEGLSYMEVKNNGSAVLIDRIYYANISVISGTDANDTFFAGGANKLAYDGEAGNDTLSYDKLDPNLGSGVTISLTNKTVDLLGDGSTIIQSYSNIESIQGTNDRNDLVEIDDNTTQADIVDVDLKDSSVEGDSLWVNYQGVAFDPNQPIQPPEYYVGIIYDIDKGLDLGTGTPLDLTKITGVENLILSQKNDEVIATQDNLIDTNPQYAIIYAYNVSVAGNLSAEFRDDRITTKNLTSRNVFAIGANTTQVTNGATPSGPQFVNFTSLNTADDTNTSGQTFLMTSSLIYNYNIVASQITSNTLSFDNDTFADNVYVSFGADWSITTTYTDPFVSSSVVLGFSGYLGEIMGGRQNDIFRFSDESFDNESLKKGTSINGGDENFIGQKNSVDLYGISNLSSVVLDASGDNMTLKDTNNKILDVGIQNIQIINLYYANPNISTPGVSPQGYDFLFSGVSTNSYKIIGGSQSNRLNFNGDSTGSNGNTGWIIFDQDYIFYSEESFYNASVNRDINNLDVVDNVVGYNNIGAQGGGNSYYALRDDHKYNLDMQDPATAGYDMTQPDNNNGIVVSYKDSYANMILTLGDNQATIEKYTEVDPSTNAPKNSITDTLNKDKQALNINKIVLSDGNNAIIIDAISPQNSVYTQDLVVDLGGSGNNYYEVANSAGSGSYTFANLAVGTSLNGHTLTILNANIISLGGGNDTYTGDYLNAPIPGTSNQVYIIDGGAGNDTLDYTSNMTNITAGVVPNITFNLITGAVYRENGVVDYFVSFETFLSGDGDDSIIFSEKSLSGSSSDFKSANLGGGTNDLDYSRVNVEMVYVLKTTNNGVTLDTTTFSGVSPVNPKGPANVSSVDSTTMFNDIYLSEFAGTFTFDATNAAFVDNNTLNVYGGTAKSAKNYIFNYNATTINGDIDIVDSDENINFSVGTNGKINLTNFGTINIVKKDSVSLEVVANDTLRNYSVNIGASGSNNIMNYSATAMNMIITITNFDKLQMSVKSPEDISNTTYSLNGFNQIVLGKGDSNVVNLTEGNTSKTITINATAGGNDTVSLSNYSAKVDVTIDSGGDLSFTGYTLTDFEVYSLTSLSDTVEVTDTASNIVLDGGRGKSSGTPRVTNENDVLDYTASTGISVIEDFGTYSSVIANTTFFSIAFDGDTGNHTMYSFNTIIMANTGNNIYSISAYDDTIISDSNFSATTFDINFGSITPSKPNTFDASLSTSTTTTYNINPNFATTSNSYQATVDTNYVGSTGPSTILPVNFTYNLLNVNNYVGTSQRDIFVINRVQSTTPSSNITIDGGNGADDSVSFTNYTTNTTIVLVLDSTGLDRANLTTTQGGSTLTATMFFRNIEEYSFGNEADQITALAEGSTNFSLGGGDNTFAYGNDVGSIDLSITLSDNEIAYEFDKGSKGKDTVSGTLKIINLSNANDTINLNISTNIKSSDALVINGVGGNDTFIFTNYVAKGGTTATLKVSDKIELIEADASTTPTTYNTLLTVTKTYNVRIDADMITTTLRLDTIVAYNATTAAQSNIFFVTSNKKTGATPAPVTLNNVVLSNSAGASDAAVMSAAGPLRIDLTNNIVAYDTAFSNVGTTTKYNSQAYNLQGLNANITNLTGTSGDDYLVLGDNKNQSIVLQNVNLAAGNNVVDFTANTNSVQLEVQNTGGDKITSKDTDSLYNTNNVVFDTQTVNEYYFAANDVNANEVTNDLLTRNTEVLYDSTGSASATAKKDIYTDNKNLGTVNLQGIDGRTMVAYGTPKIEVIGFSIYQFGVGTSVIVDNNYNGNDEIEVRISGDIPATGDSKAINFGFSSTNADANSTVIDIKDSTIANALIFEYNVNTKIIKFNLSGGSSKAEQAKGFATNSSDAINITTDIVDSDVAFTLDTGGGIDTVNNSAGKNVDKSIFTFTGTGLDYYITETNLKNHLIKNAEIFNVNSANIDIEGSLDSTLNIYEVHTAASSTTVNLKEEANTIEVRSDGVYVAYEDQFVLGLYGDITNYNLVNKDNTINTGITTLKFISVPSNANSTRPVVFVADSNFDSQAIADFSSVNILGDTIYTIGIQKKDLIGVNLSGDKVELENFGTVILQTTPGQQSGVSVVYKYDSSANVSDNSHIWQGAFYGPGSGASNQTLTIDSSAAGQYSVYTGTSGQGNLEVRVKKTAFTSATSDDLLYGNWITTYKESVDLQLGNAAYDSVFSRDIQLNENEGLVSEYKLSTQEDDIDIIGMEGNLIVDTGRGHDNINLYGRADDYTYTYLDQDYVVIDGYTYYTGGDLIVVSNGSGEYMYFFNSTLDEVNGGTYVDEEDFFNESLDNNDTALLNYDDRQTQEYYDELDALRPSNSSKRHNNESNNDLNDEINQSANNNASNPDSNQNINNENSVDTYDLKQPTELNLDNLLSINTKEDLSVDNLLNQSELNNNIFNNDINLDSLDLDSLYNVNIADGSINSVLKDILSISDVSCVSVNEMDIVDNYKLSDEDNSDSLHQIHNLLNKHNQNSGNHS